MYQRTGVCGGTVTSEPRGYRRYTNVRGQGPTTFVEHADGCRPGRRRLSRKAPSVVREVPRVPEMSRRRGTVSGHPVLSREPWDTT